jgi:hypothetical protein
MTFESVKAINCEDLPLFLVMCDLMVLGVHLNSVKLLSSTINIVASTYYDFNNMVNAFFAYQQLVTFPISLSRTSSPMRPKTSPSKSLPSKGSATAALERSNTNRPSSSTFAPWSTPGLSKTRPRSSISTTDSGSSISAPKS